MERRTFLRGIMALIVLKPVAATFRRSRPTPVLNHGPEFVRFKGVRVDSFTLSIPKGGMVEARVEGLIQTKGRFDAAGFIYNPFIPLS